MESNKDNFSPFISLWNDVAGLETFPSKRPLLAHYTSISALENIVRNDELWFSNPLYMNDLEELRFGILEGAQAFRDNELIKTVCGTAERHQLLLNAFEGQYSQFDLKHAFDTYVFCLSEHDINDTDGLLSMWRGYGENGGGAAIIIDTAQLNYTENSPLIISKVDYASNDERREWIDKKLTEFATLLNGNHIPDEQLHMPAYMIFERIKTFALFTKHRGFSEEREWRVVYLRERDTDKKIDGMLHYSIGRNGVEPKLKYKVKPITGLTEPDLSLEKIIHQIILGPTVSNFLAITAVGRMFEKVGKQSLKEKLIASSTPFRTG